MRVNDALSTTILGRAQVVAGAKGVNRAIRWVHIVDMPDVVAWVRPGQLLLTTGYALPHDSAGQRELIRSLATQELAGIGLAVPRFFDHFPAVCREEADRLDLPLLEIPWEIPFAQITEELHTVIVAEQSRLLEQSETIHRRLTRAAQDAASLQDLATTLGELIHRAVTFEDQERRVLGYYRISEMEDEVRQTSLRLGFSPPDLEARLSALGYSDAIRQATQPLRIPPFPDLGFSGRIVCPIRLKGEFVGKVWIIEGETPLSDLDLRAAEHAALIAALQIAHQQAMASLEARVGYSFLSALLEGRFEATPQSLERARLQGFDPDSCYSVGVFVLDEPIPLTREGVLRREAFADRLRQHLFKLNAAPLLSVSINQVPCLLPETCDADTLWAQLADPGIAFGLSRVYRDISGIRHAYVEVQAMLAHIKFGQFQRFEDLLLPRVLMGDTDAQAAFLLRLFEPLRRRKNGNMLMKTLVAFAQSDFHLRRTAERMCMHPKSLRYRLQRIAEIAGLDFSSPETRFEVQLAVRLMTLQDECTS